jgi:hypothetical protein
VVVVVVQAVQVVRHQTQPLLAMVERELRIVFQARRLGTLVEAELPIGATPTTP